MKGVLVLGDSSTRADRSACSMGALPARARDGERIRLKAVESVVPWLGITRGVKSLEEGGVLVTVRSVANVTEREISLLSPDVTEVM